MVVVKLLNIAFPVEVVNEGRINIMVPKLELFSKEAPSKAPVFYNPVMELNRDLAVLALQTHQRIVGRDLKICEPLTGCGVRGIRFGLEVNGVKEIILSDINPKAVQLTRVNIIHNKLEERILVVEEDANLILSRCRKKLDFVDIDPFGSPAPYLDSAIRALCDGGLLAITATDMAPLCGVHKQACIRKYGGKPMRTEYCHELAVRLLIGCLVMTAAKHELGVKVVFSYSTFNYIRIYVVADRGVKHADESVQRLGYVLHCFSCSHREISRGSFSFLKQRCSRCGATLNLAGPLWLGELSDEDFCSLMKEEALKRNLRHVGKIVRLLDAVKKEGGGPITYYVTDRICDKLNISTPPLIKVVDHLRKEGFHAIPTHFNSKGVRTDAPIEILEKIIKKLIISRSSNN